MMLSYKDECGKYLSEVLGSVLAIQSRYRVVAKFGFMVLLLNGLVPSVFCTGSQSGLNASTVSAPKCAKSILIGIQELEMGNSLRREVAKDALVVFHPSCRAAVVCRPKCSTLLKRHGRIIGATHIALHSLTFEGLRECRKQHTSW